MASLYQGTTGLLTLVRVLSGACLSSIPERAVLYSLAYISNSSAVVGSSAAYSAVYRKSLFSCYISMDLIFLWPIVLTKRRGLDGASQHKTAAWSDMNWSTTGVLRIRFSDTRVMVRSRVYPSRWVGSSTCCFSPRPFKSSYNFSAHESWGSSSWMLKSPVISNCF